MFLSLKFINYATNSVTWGEVVSAERLVTIILDASPREKYSTIKIQAVRAVLMGTKSCTKILILPKIFPRFRFTFYG